METQEILKSPEEVFTAPVWDDFEIGDRIYVSLPGSVIKGEVVSNSGERDGSIEVLLDYGESMSLPISAFGDQNLPEHCGRIPNLDLIEKGTVLSRLQENGSRIYAVVSIHEPGRKLVFYRKDKFLPYEYQTSHGVDLERILFDWEIEG